MNREDNARYEDRDQPRHRHADRGRPSFEMNNDEYDQRGGNNNDRDRDTYSNHTRGRAGDQYRNEKDDRFEDRGQYSSSRNYGGMGGFGGAQGFGTSRAGRSNQTSAHREQDRGRFAATSGRGSRRENDDDSRQGERNQDRRHLYGGYRDYRREEDEERGNQDRNRPNQRDQNRSSDYEGQISGGEFSPMLGGSPSRGWYTPSEGGYSRSGGYVGPGGVDQGSRRTNYDQDDDANYGLTFGDDIHYDPTSRNRRDTHVQDTERRSMEKYGSESRDLDQVRGWHYDARLDRRYGRENQGQNPDGWRKQDRQNRNNEQDR